MRKRDELSDPNSCMNRARDDEWTFVLLGRDVAACTAVAAWIAERIRLGKNKPDDPQIAEARMWIARNDHRRPDMPPISPRFQGTPGPWRANCFPVEAQRQYGGREICHTGGGRGGSEESEANARLIAAAPELLAACQRAYDCCYDKNSEDGRLLRAAIDKALGSLANSDSAMPKT